MQQEVPLIERLHRVARATILCRHALNDLCADYLRAVAIIHAGELTKEQADALEDVAQWFANTANEVQRAFARLDIVFEGCRETK